MKCLWLTLADPDPPENGQYLYSSGLIHAVASAGLDLHVVGLTRPGASHFSGERADRVTWQLASHRPSSQWIALASTLPQLAVRTRTREMQHSIGELLERNQWDVVLFDSIAIGWALPAVLRHARSAARPPRLVYLSHNHEENVARRIARDEPNFFKRQVRLFDALKIARLERALVRNADVMTSNSPEDCQQFGSAWPGKPIRFLPPGYRQPHIAERQITSEIPRRAIIVGSFEWFPKRLSLENFLRVADPLFAKAGVELHVVGNARTAYLDQMRGTVAATTFTGYVDDVRPHMAQARLALVPDHLGGFKLKALDYVFNRLPILAISGSVPGMPLRQAESILLHADHEALAHGVLRIIDDFDALNRMQDFAYLACRDQFDWSAIGRRLISAISLVDDLRRSNRVAAPLQTAI
jgi:polysaccharide biosynthesis protein PslH